MIHIKNPNERALGAGGLHPSGKPPTDVACGEAQLWASTGGHLPSTAQPPGPALFWKDAGTHAWVAAGASRSLPAARAPGLQRHMGSLPLSQLDPETQRPEIVFIKTRIIMKTP